MKITPAAKDSPAEAAGLRVAQKKDSYEICFVPNDDYAGFLKSSRGHSDTEGDFVDPDGNVLGQHGGYEKFTVGQRKGLGITFGEPRFVIRVDAASRQVVLGRRDDLATTTVTASGLNWLTDPPAGPFTCEAKFRYQQQSRRCKVELTDDDTAVLTPEEPIMGVAPGQAAVFYDGDRVLGGGWIQASA